MNKTEIDWLNSRKRGVGSSDSPVLALGEVFKRTPVDLYIDKISPVGQQQDNSNFRRGHTYEPLAIALAEAKMGMKIHSPNSDIERWNDYQVFSVSKPFMFADFDGIREDGWIIEVKSPLQRIADKIRMEGLKDYYLIQGQHLAWVANDAGVPYMVDPGKCPGICFIIYEPENVDVQVYEIPFNSDMAEAICRNAEKFWINVMSRVPPTDHISVPVYIPKSKGKAVYQPVDGEAWKEAELQYIVANEMLRTASRRVETAKATIKQAIETIGIDKVITENGHKFSFAMQNGRKSIDMKMLIADNPTIDLKKYEVQGQPYKSLRHYGPNEKVEVDDASLDDQLLTLRDELENLSTTNIEDSLIQFDDLRNRAEMYGRMLSMELEGINSGLKTAAEKIQNAALQTGGKNED